MKITEINEMLSDTEAYVRTCMLRWSPKYRNSMAQEIVADRRSAEREIRRRIRALVAADIVLVSAAAGDFLYMEGSCPSGPTYGECWTFNDSAEQRAEILEKVWKLSYPDAWCSTLCSFHNVSAWINSHWINSQREENAIVKE